MKNITGLSEFEKDMTICRRCKKPFKVGLIEMVRNRVQVCGDCRTKPLARVADTAGKEGYRGRGKG